MNIAICDDEDIFRKHFRELLLKESFVQNTDIQVWECASGEELLAACSEAGFHADVIFLDIRMKGMDGMEAAGREMPARLFDQSVGICSERL